MTYTYDRRTAGQNKVRKERDGNYSCTCQEWQHSSERPRTCKHLKKLEQQGKI